MERDFNEVMLYIAQFLKVKHSLKGVVGVGFLRGHAALVAKEMGTTVGHLSKWKQRNSFTTDGYSSVLGFCHKNDINPLNVFYDRRVKV